MFESLQTPYLLLSTPDLNDPNFAHSVILVGHHTNGGAIGWIVNRIIEPKAVGLLPPPLNETIHPDTPLRLGGPVLTNGLIVVFHKEMPAIESVEMAPGIHVSASPEILPALFTNGPCLGRRPSGLLVFGYAGWGAGQLEREMEEGSWLVLPYEESFAFSDQVDDLWERALARLGVKPEAVSMPVGGIN